MVTTRARAAVIAATTDFDDEDDQATSSYEESDNEFSEDEESDNEIDDDHNDQAASSYEGSDNNLTMTRRKSGTRMKMSFLLPSGSVSLRLAHVQPVLLLQDLQQSRRARARGTGHYPLLGYPKPR
jgi:hypothetical protein